MIAGPGPAIALWLALWLAIVTPSSPIVHRFLGAWGLLGYAVVMALLIAVAGRLQHAIRHEYAKVLAAAGAIAFVIVFAVIYPRVNVHTPGAGSDDDDAHDDGVALMLEGSSPYSRPTYLGNEHHLLPGSYILAAPFALAGASALQNLVCLPLFYLLLRRRTNDRPALMIWSLATVANVAVLHAVVTGSSYPWNAIWVLLAMHVLLSHPRNVLAAAFFALAICTRSNVALLAVPLMALLWRREGAVIVGQVAAIVGGVIALLVLPFRPWTLGFAPSQAYARLEVLDEIVPGFAPGVLLLTLVVTAIAAVRVKDEGGLYLASAVILATPVAAGIALSAAGRPDIVRSLAPYGLFATWFLAMAMADGRRVSSPASPR